MSQTILEQTESWGGVRMSADEFLALGETRERYQLINGVVCISPSASFKPQRISYAIARQLGEFLRKHPIGTALGEIDVRLDDELVYRPDVIYLSLEKAARCDPYVTEVPDVVVEVVSPDS